MQQVDFVPDGGPWYEPGLENAAALAHGTISKIASELADRADDGDDDDYARALEAISDHHRQEASNLDHMWEDDHHYADYSDQTTAKLTYELIMLLGCDSV